MAGPNQRRSEQPRHRKIVRVGRFNRLEDGDDTIVAPEAGLAIAQQCGHAHVGGIGAVQGVELFGGVAQSAFLVIGQRQIKAERGIPRVFNERGAVLLDRFVEAAQLGKHRAEVGARLDHLRVQRQQLLVLADGERVIALLLGLDGVPEELFRRRRLRRRGAGGKKEQGNGPHRFQNTGVALSYGGRPQASVPLVQARPGNE